MEISTWFFLAVSAPFLWAIVNIMDEYLISKYYNDENAGSGNKIGEEHGSVGSLVLYSSLFGIFVSLGIFIFRPSVLSVSIQSILLLILSGILAVGWIVCYMKAIQGSSASSVVTWFQTIPVFGYFFGIFVLNEFPTGIQILGSLLILTGAVVATMEFSQGVVRARKREILYMLLASLLVAISGGIFKAVAIDNDFWLSTFWESAGLAITGIGLYAFHAKYRRDFQTKLISNGKKILSINLLNEVFSSVGNVMNNFAMLLAPLALVFSVNTIQPLYVFILSIIFTLLWPHLGKENLGRKALVAKSIAITLVIVGSIIILQ